MTYDRMCQFLKSLPGVRRLIDHFTWNRSCSTPRAPKAGAVRLAALFGDRPRRLGRQQRHQAGDEGVAVLRASGWRGFGGGG